MWWPKRFVEVCGGALGKIVRSEESMEGTKRMNGQAKRKLLRGHTRFCRS